LILIPCREVSIFNSKIVSALQLINLIETINANDRFIINEILPKFLPEYFKPIRGNFNVMPLNRIQTGLLNGPVMGVST
jgi:hypothetical protein